MGRNKRAQEKKPPLPTRPVRFLAAATHGIAVLAVGLACAILLFEHLSPVPAIILTALLATGWFVAASVLVIDLEGMRSIFSGLMAAILMFVAGFGYKEYADVAQGRILHNIPVSEAAYFTDAVGFSFTDARVAGEFPGSYTYSYQDKDSGTRKTVVVHAAPLVSRGWTPDQPVSLWAACRQDQGPCRRTWEKDLGSAIKASAINYPDFEQAVQDAIAKHQLGRIPELLIMEWVESPEQAVKHRKWFFRFLCLMVFTVWAVGILHILVQGNPASRDSGERSPYELEGDTRFAKYSAAMKRAAWMIIASLAAIRFRLADKVRRGAAMEPEFLAFLGFCCTGLVFAWLALRLLRAMQERKT